ncbi:hypothetical protein [Streptomyces sp. NPDC048659]|uniref:hypothetical protein n=1 Tax=Streptomyces sp. NPDC048659 TaxID=3155489 RepID=UPI00341AEC81
MSTEPQRPASRITDALLPPDRPGPPPKPPRPTPPAPAEPPAAPARPPLAAPAGPPAPPAPRHRPPAPPLPAGPALPAAPARPPHAAPPSPGPVRPLPAAETTTRLRPVPPAHPAAPARPAPPAPAADPHPYGGVDRWALPDELPAETTTRLRPVQDRRTGRVLAAAGCAVLGIGLIGGALAGAVLAESGAGAPAEPPGYSRAQALWHDAPVDTLFPRTLGGPTAGPGGAARTWTRVVVAPDAPCTAAALPTGLLTALKEPGCARVLRATYTDATASYVTTVALVFTQADPDTMRTLGSRAEDEPPPALAGPGTVAARFGAPQRGSWWRHVLPDLPVVVTSVSGFADGRPVAEAEPAARAMTAKRTTAVAQAGLGHEAKGVGDGVERALRKTVAATAPGADR